MNDPQWFWLVIMAVAAGHVAIMAMIYARRTWTAYKRFGDYTHDKDHRFWLAVVVAYAAATQVWSVAAAWSRPMPWLSALLLFGLAFAFGRLNRSKAELLHEQEAKLGYHLRLAVIEAMTDQELATTVRRLTAEHLRRLSAEAE